MAYADYAFYRDTYSGDLIKDEMVFVRLALRASERLDHYTMRRIDQSDISNDVRLAVCAMAEVLFWQEKRKNKYDGREIASESNDGYSVSFAGATDSERASLTEKELYLAAYKYLSQTGLMDFEVET